MATMDEIMDAVRAYGVLSMRLGVDYLSETLVEQHEQFNRIRSMLAPVAPAPGLREAIADAIEETLYPRLSMIDGESDYPDYFNAADAVLAVLGERGMA